MSHAREGKGGDDGQVFNVADRETFFFYLPFLSICAAVTGSTTTLREEGRVLPGASPVFMLEYGLV